MKTYAEKAICKLMEGHEITIDERKYIYQDGQFLTKAIRIENGIESEVWLGGMCSEMTLEYFLNYCKPRTFEDMIMDFPIHIPN